MKKEDFKVTCMLLNAGKIALLLTLAIVIWTNDWFLILVELGWIGVHILLFSFAEFLIRGVNKK